MTQSEFESVLQQIASLKRELTPHEQAAKVLTAQIEDLKFKAMAHMQQTRSKRSEPLNGYYLVRVAGRTKKVVSDESAAVDWLASLNDEGDITDYYKLDEDAVVARVEKHLHETGELVDFIEVQQGPEHITVKEETR